MNWRLVIKDPNKQPTRGTYSDWKEQIAEECYYQCVYCSIHEGQFGGINNYHLDHFRPKSLYRDLENNILNIFYACPICNRFKKDDWPAEPDLNVISYPDPSIIDYSSLFNLRSDFQIEGKNNAANYLVIRLFLNRAQLIMERREEAVIRHVTDLISQISDLIERIGDWDLSDALIALKEVDKVKTAIMILYEDRRKIRPYKLKDIRKI